MRKKILFLSFLFILICVCFLFWQHVKKQQDESQSAKVENINNYENNGKEKTETFYKIDEYIDYDIVDDSQKTEEPSIYYLALGDSLTKGVGDEQNKSGFTSRLAEKIEKITNVEIVLDNRGKRGRRSEQLLKLIEKGHYDEEIEKAGFITITIGGNDIMKIVKETLFRLEKKPFDVERIEFEKRLKKIVSDIYTLNPHVPIVLVGLYNPFTNINEDIKEFDVILSEWNGTIKQIANENPNACFVNVDDLFDSNMMVYHTDFFHPNGYGYTKMTERILLKMMECNMISSIN